MTTPHLKTTLSSLGLLVALGSSNLLALKIEDYQRRLNPRFEKKIRAETRFIIIHSTEGRLPSSLRTLSRGKVYRGRYVTRGGHAHYLVAKSGAVYRILDPIYWANHAGVSMWNGLESLSDYSIGIELEGYHDVPFTDPQYASLKKLLEILQRRFKIKDRDVLEHYRVAYAAPNRYHQSRQRGRKLDPGADNFDRLKAGLDDMYRVDPDVIAERISGSPGLMRASGTEPSDLDLEGDEDTAEDTLLLEDSNKITSDRTAWQIAGLEHKAPTTVYEFPDGTSVRGDQVRDWSNIPPGTRVRLGVPEETEAAGNGRPQKEVMVPETNAQQSPWKIANALYNSSMTYYVLPDGQVREGSHLDTATVPDGTKVLVAYREIRKPQFEDALGEDLDDVYLAPQTLYLLPNRIFRSGDQIEDFRDLPQSLRVFTKVD